MAYFIMGEGAFCQNLGYTEIPHINAPKMTDNYRIDQINIKK